MLLSFVFCILTSIILYIVPHGRVAYWADWHLWGMTKTQWGNLHVTLGLLFLLAGFLHLFYNWKVITAYMKNKSRELKVFTPSFNVALVLCLAVGFTTYFEVPPVYSVISFGESIKDAGAEKYGEPPYGHAELSSLKGFCSKMDIDLDKAQEALAKAAIVYENEQQSIIDIASANEMTPKALYELIRPAAPEQTGPIAFPSEPYPGFGRELLGDICTKFSLDTEAVLQGLAKQNIQADATKSIKDIAAAQDMDPHAFFAILHNVVTQL